MAHGHERQPAGKPDWRRIITSFAIEVAIYGILLMVYFLLVLRFLADPLMRIFQNRLVVYAFVSLGLIVAQGALLDGVTSFLVKQFGLDHFD